MWRQRSAPRTLPRPLRQLVREMLLLADRITAVQVAVAALPTSTTSSSSTGGTSSSSGGSCHTADSSAPAGEDPAGSLAQPPGGGAVGGDAAEASIQYVVSVLTRPLHESHQQQLQLVAAVAAAVQQVLLQPSPDATQHLQHVIGQLECERARSSALIAQLRKRLHHDVMHVPPQQQHDTRPAHPDQQQQGHPAMQHMEPRAPGVNGAPSPQQEDQLVRSLSVAMGSDGVLPVVGAGAGSAGGGSSSGGLHPADLAVHISRWWWVHAGEHYCQLLAFQYAFDSVVVGVLAIAHTALSL